MSFFSNFSSDRCPGTISGNPLNGLCEKVCIQAEKIFDAGIIQTRLENYNAVITNPVPANPTYPLTFISARSLSSGVTVSNLNVERQTEGQCARVQVTVTVPSEIVYVDGNGGGKLRFARGHVQRRRRVCNQRVHHAHFKGCNAGGAARSQLRLLRHSARAGIHAGGLLGVLRAAALPAGKSLFEKVNSAFRPAVFGGFLFLRKEYFVISKRRSR